MLQAKANTEHDLNRAGLYHFAILLPERKYLADMLQNLREKGKMINLDGLADHLIAESIYTHEPDFNSIEIYRERPVTEWRWKDNKTETTTLPLNTMDLQRELTKKGWKEMQHKTIIGYVHIQVSSITKAIKFYHDMLGMSITANIPSDTFFTTSKYNHHHISVNTWR